MAIFPNQPSWGNQDSAERDSWFPFLNSCFLILLVLGISWRVLRYFLRLPFWGDEAFVCLNFLDRDFMGLLQPLRFNQVAPLLFLWSELAAYRLLGGTELALRLLPFLASLGALGLFWRLTRAALAPLAGLFAFGFLAVAYYPVRHGCEVKPYAFDLLISLTLLIPAWNWLREPTRLIWIGLLAALVPLAMVASYPAVFIAGAISVALLPTAWKGNWQARGLYVLYNLLLMATFGVLYLVVGRGQFSSTGGIRNSYWEPWFPPTRPMELIRWLISVHTGNMLAYPVGSQDGGSLLTFFLCLIGVWKLWRSKQGSLLLLCLVPFALTFVAGALHRYPYGGSARVAQHLAPAICLLAGTGVASLVLGFAHSASIRKWSIQGVCILLCLLAIGGMARDLVKPYKTDGDRMVRKIVHGVFREAEPGDPIVIIDPYGRMGATFEWYLKQQGDRLTWNNLNNLSLPGEKTCQIWCLRFGENDPEPTWLADSFQGKRMLALLDHAGYTLQLGQSDDTIEHCEVFHWVCLPEPEKNHEPGIRSLTSTPNSWLMGSGS